MNKKFTLLQYLQMAIMILLVACIAFLTATPSGATGETHTPTVDMGATTISLYGTTLAEIFATQIAALMPSFIM
jgi:hypothetical protein